MQISHNLCKVLSYQVISADRDTDSDGMGVMNVSVNDTLANTMKAAEDENINLAMVDPLGVSMVTEKVWLAGYIMALHDHFHHVGHHAAGHDRHHLPVWHDATQALLPAQTQP